jgi:hypothetical protein
MPQEIKSTLPGSFQGVCLCSSVFVSFDNVNVAFVAVRVAEMLPTKPLAFNVAWGKGTHCHCHSRPSPQKTSHFHLFGPFFQIPQ